MSMSQSGGRLLQSSSSFYSLFQGSGDFLAERAMKAVYLKWVSMRAIQLGIGVTWDHKIFLFDTNLSNWAIWRL